MPHSLPLLDDLLILLLASIPIAFACSRLRLPVSVGFMVTGIIIGPYGLGLIKDVPAVEALAEIGVVLLLFTIGLEFSLKRIAEMKKLVLGGGGLQVLVTTFIVAGIAYLAGRSFNQGLFFGFLFALSSTAIVLKSYIDRLEVDTPHGRAGVGILIFQDLCIVPMMLLVPILSGKEGSSLTNIAITLGSALAVIAGIILAARFAIPFLLSYVVRMRSSEVFIIFVVAVSLGTAWLTSFFGLSMALGAFMAGLVLAESDYSHQIVSDVMPFRDVFNSVFFISIGMLLSIGFLMANLPIVTLWVVALIAGKTLIILAIVRLLGSPLRVAAITGIGLAQVGEFSFILTKVGVAQGLLNEVDHQRFLAASIISMIATPFLIKAAPKIGLALHNLFSPDSRLEPDFATQVTNNDGLHDHVIVVGYGMNGRNLTKVLHHTGIPFVVLEMNAETVRSASTEGVPIQYGDSMRREVLNHVAIQNAAIMVIAISDPLATRHTIAVARELNPNLKIIVRTRYMSELPELHLLGADQVIPEEFETSVEIFARVLREYGVARNVIQHEIEAIRSEGYQMLRSPSLPLADLDRLAEVLATLQTETVLIEDDSRAVGKSLKELDLRHQTGVTVTAIVRNAQTEVNPSPSFRIAVGDILVLIGKPEEVEAASEYINRGEVVSKPRTVNSQLIHTRNENQVSHSETSD
ncbi:MAG TPA: cation:proton antiporter, partial [Blastocatellia bacterium]|nr:cation:proton antiporter [Blastocatellia bacterium]